MPKRKLADSGTVLLIVPLIFMGIFYFFPLGKLVSLSFSQTSSSAGQAINWQIIGNAAGFTFYQAGLSTLFTILLGLPAAFLFGRFNFSGKNALRIASTLPFILPTVVVAVGFNTLIGPSGLINTGLMAIFGKSEPLFNIQNSLAAIILAHVFYNTSIIIRVVSSALAQLDHKLEDAAQTLGAAPWKTFTKITLPLLLPYILSAVLLVFLFDFTSFGVILMLGGPRFSTLEVEIYIQTMQFLNLPLAGWLSFIQLGFTMFVSFLLMKIGGGGMGSPVMPRLKQEGLRKPLKAWEKIFTGVMVLGLIILLASPVISLVVRSFRTPIADISMQKGDAYRWSINNYRELFINRQLSLFYVPPIRAVWNSIKFAGTSALIALSLGLMLAYGLLSRKNTEVVNLLMLLPLGTSSVTLGLGFFTAFSALMGSLNWLVFLLFLFLAWAGDGANSLITALLGKTLVYETTNMTRLVTGFGMGLVMSTILMTLFNMTAWKEGINDPLLENWRQIGYYAAAATLTGFTLLNSNAIFFQIFAYISIGTVIIIISMLYAIFWIILFKKENNFSSWSALGIFLAAGFTTRIMIEVL